MGEEVKDVIEVVVVEDDPRTMKNMVRLLNGYDDFQVVGSALSGEAAIETVAAWMPQVVVLDLELPGIDGIQVTSKIKAVHPEIEILILTSFDDEVKVYQAMQAGASGYLVKRMAPQKIREAIHEVLNGGTVIEPRLAKRFWNYFQSVKGKKAKQAKPLLSDVERDVLQMIARGLTNQEAGGVLNIERRTVRTHLTHIYRKLGTNSRSEAVVIALRDGLINF